ncbi:MAG TPA: hypothetical protein VHC21_02680 [Candidatus Saccharimonadales bacterium]|nr:hypothetical protein [Candidatus Saccharimonadales bacterium]
MGEIPAMAGTADELEHAFDSAKVVNGGRIDGDILNTFLGAAELHLMGDDLIKHMRDEDRWGSSTISFSPIDFTVAAFEVAHDHTVGHAERTNVHIRERLPSQLTTRIFMCFWLPRIAKVAYGPEYGDEVRSIVRQLTNPE